MFTTSPNAVKSFTASFVPVDPTNACPRCTAAPTDRSEVLGAKPIGSDRVEDGADPLSGHRASSPSRTMPSQIFGCGPKPSEAGLEGVAAQPISLLAAPFAHLEDAAGLADDHTADAIDLRLAGEPTQVDDGLSQGARTVVGDQLWNDCREHVCIVATSPGRRRLPSAPGTKRHRRWT